MNAWGPGTPSSGGEVAFVRTVPGLMEMLSEAYLGSRHAVPRMRPL
jgi:hypothetical protein